VLHFHCSQRPAILSFWLVVSNSNLTPRGNPDQIPEGKIKTFYFYFAAAVFLEQQISIIE